jgi:Concanavalin A-like lectin/glucanases superfamily
MTYAAVVLADNPKHFWRLADPGGSLAHDIGSSPSHIAGSTLDSGYTGPSSDGGSWYSSGNAGEGLFSYVAVSQVTPLSVELWFYQLWNLGVASYLIAWDNAVNPSLYAWITVAGLVNSNINGSAQINSLAGPSIQAWHHLVLTYDGATYKMFLDNVAQSNTAYVAAFTIARNLGLMNKPTGANVFTGFMSDVAIYAYALNNAQITNHWNAADTKGQAPVYHAPGKFDVTTGLFTATPVDVSTILSSVRKVY